MSTFFPALSFVRPAPRETVSEVGHPPAYLSTAELARRWHVKPKTITRTFRKFGFTPLRPGGGPHLFALTQIAEVEAKLMSREIASLR